MTDGALPQRALAGAAAANSLSATQNVLPKRLAKTS
jgi:hypothetical protein